MTGKTLLYAMAYIGADLVDEAEKRPFRKPVWQRWARLAACLSLAAGLAWGALHLTRSAFPAQEPVSVELAEQDTVPTVQDSSPKELEGQPPLLVYHNFIYHLPDPLKPCGKIIADEDAVFVGYVDEGQPLAGAACYYDKKYVNWAADGIPVLLLLEYEGEYYDATTYGEQADRTMPYTYDEARKMTGETLYHTFIAPIEDRALDETLTYTSGQSPTSLEQLALFGGMVSMEDASGFVSRYARADRWLPVGWDVAREKTEWELYVPVSEIQNLLDTYFNGCILDPRALPCYDSSKDTIKMDWQYMPYGYERSDFSASLLDFHWDDETQTVQIWIELAGTEWEALPEQDVSGGISYREISIPLGQKCYTIKFTSHGPKYLRIEWVTE